MVRAIPHSQENLAPGSFVAPQEGQAAVCARARRRIGCKIGQYRHFWCRKLSRSRYPPNVYGNVHLIVRLPSGEVNRCKHGRRKYPDAF